MILVGNPVEDFGNFELDLSKVKLASESDKFLFFPYKGKLPERFADAKSCVLYINVELGCEASAAMICDYADGRSERHTLSTTADEVKSLLERYFYGANKSRGVISDYYYGYRQACYESWRRLMEQPRRLRANIAEMDSERREVLKSVVNRW